MECRIIDGNSLDPDVKLVFLAFKKHFFQLNGSNWDKVGDTYKDVDGLVIIMKNLGITAGHFEKFIKFQREKLGLSLEPPHFQKILDLLSQP